MRLLFNLSVLSGRFNIVVINGPPFQNGAFVFDRNAWTANAQTLPATAWLRWWIPASIIALGVLLAALFLIRSEFGSGTDRVPGAIWEARSVAVIGNDSTEPNSELGAIAGVALLPDGRIVVADATNDVIRVFREDGAPLLTFGRRGQGPGEFRRMCCPAVDREGRIWVRNGGNMRLDEIEVADSGLSHVRSLSIVARVPSPSQPLTFDAEGRLVDVGGVRDAATGTLVQHRIHLDREGRTERDVTIPPAPPESLAMVAVPTQAGATTTTNYVYQPYGPELLVAHGTGGQWARAVSTRYRISLFDESGVERQVITSAVRGPALSREERAKAEDQLARDANNLGLARGQIELDVPDRRPPIRNVLFDEAGRLWIEETVSPGSARHARVYDRNGHWIASATWPAEVNLARGIIRDGVALGVQTDADGLQRIVVLRWDRGGAADDGRAP
jgi:hypothetical protein